ncbi:BQ5605_C052g12571 [Microbotryum silenes-dioicae]|uniref:BQ5605_C052g12571 protein n=1 Tax=Microbotryum silenes-dioicae TaxID=796604 RepID=A0A2X0MSB0_9BASI|nr:BQ5605_C052g12571 [Microbotryum silenes-dioicae]
MQNGQRGQRDGQLDAGLAPPPPPPERRVRRARIALKPLKARLSIRDELGPQTAVCTHCKARNWECERSRSTGHSSTCCWQGKVQLLPPPQPNPEYRRLLEGSDSGRLLLPTTSVRKAKVFRKNARSYNNALLCTSLAAQFDQTRQGTLGLPCIASLVAFTMDPMLAQTWLIDLVEATDTRIRDGRILPSRDRSAYLHPVSSRKPAPHHGPRHHRCCNGLTPDQIRRSPSLFITVTCNPVWPEIKAALGPNDTACNRPDAIARAFEAKLKRLCDDFLGHKHRAGCFAMNGDQFLCYTSFLVFFLSTSAEIMCTGQFSCCLNLEFHPPVNSTNFPS